jgi:hypothetical protein
MVDQIKIKNEKRPAVHAELLPAKGPAKGMAQVAEGLRRDFAEFRRLASATSLQMVKVGFRLMWVRENIPHGGWMSWIEENAPEISQRQANYLIKTAEEIGDQWGCIDSRQRELLALGDESVKGYKGVEQMLMSFLGDDTPMELMRRLGVRKPIAKVEGPATADPTDTPEHIVAADAWSEIKRLLYHHVQREKTYAHLRAGELGDAYQILKDAAAELRRAMS